MVVVIVFNGALSSCLHPGLRFILLVLKVKSEPITSQLRSDLVEDMINCVRQLSIDGTIFPILGDATLPLSDDTARKQSHDRCQERHE